MSKYIKVDDLLSCIKYHRKWCDNDEHTPIAESEIIKFIKSEEQEMVSGDDAWKIITYIDSVHSNSKIDIRLANIAIFLRELITLKPKKYAGLTDVERDNLSQENTVKETPCQTIR